MKTIMRMLPGFMIASAFIACEKSTELDVNALQMELEACKPGKKNLAIGMEYQGGIIFYLDETGKHGLITAKEDLGPAPWGCFGTSFPEVSSATDSKIASKILLASCREPGIAARLCARYEVREKGMHGRKYKDWYMAGRSELLQIIGALGKDSKMCGNTYWTFTESSSSPSGPLDPGKWALAYSFGCTEEPEDFNWWGQPRPQEKFREFYARPIRTF